MSKGFNLFGFSGDFAIYGFLLMLILLIVVGLIVYAVLCSIAQWRRNKRSPRYTVHATVIAKRSDITYHYQSAGTGAGIQYSTSSTDYYVTFQLDAGKRIELSVPDSEYGMLVEGDRGMLTYQGTWYWGFERKLDAYDSERYQNQ